MLKENKTPEELMCEPFNGSELALVLMQSVLSLSIANLNLFTSNIFNLCAGVGLHYRSNTFNGAVFITRENGKFTLHFFTQMNEKTKVFEQYFCREGISDEKIVSNITFLTQSCQN